jgi:hypothetical protein
VTVIGGLVRIFSFLFHFILAFFLLGVSGVAMLAGTHTIKLGVLPWEGATLTYGLFFSALVGLVAVLLAVKRTAPVVFVVWCVVVFVMLFRGFFFSPYNFANGGLSTPAYLTIGSLLAILGSWSQYRRTPARSKDRVTV